MPELKLYFVRADDEDGENVDLFVWAPNAKAAKRHWKSHFKDWDVKKPEYVVALPARTTEGPIEWDELLKNKETP